MEIEFTNLSEKLKNDLLNEISKLLNLSNNQIKLLKVEFELDDISLNLNDIEKNTLIKALTRSSGNISKASQLLGVTRKTVYSLIKKYNLVSFVHINE
jgi:transcriptional regulator of acetoin/glycerol metabolism